MKFIGLLWLACCLPAWADHYSPITVWQTVPFIKGQDLCQFQDAYGSTAQENHKNLSQQLIHLLNAGADPAQLVDLLNALDRNTQLNRERATAGKGMDVLLEGSLKASLDAQYTKLQPRNRNITFFNPAPIYALARDLRDEKRQGYLDAGMLGKLNAMAWGTYSYAPTCKGDLLVTLHIQVTSGRTYNYQARGRPDQVMLAISSQLFAEFQHTQFPSKVKMGNRTLELIGTPGAPADGRRIRIRFQSGRLEPRCQNGRACLGFGKPHGLGARFAQPFTDSSRKRSSCERALLLLRQVMAGEPTRPHLPVCTRQSSTL
jgi:hypothetical protein